MPGSDIRIQAGKQRQLIRIMQPVPGPVGAAGATVIMQLFLGPIPAEIVPVSARDLIRSGQAVAQVIVPITIRYCRGVAANMIVEHLESKQGVYSVVGTYVVQGILNVDERNWKMTLACLALGANQ